MNSQHMPMLTAALIASGVLRRRSFLNKYDLLTTNEMTFQAAPSFTLIVALGLLARLRRVSRRRLCLIRLQLCRSIIFRAIFDILF